jgi:hypothetical protein
MRIIDLKDRFIRSLVAGFFASIILLTYAWPKYSLRRAHPGDMCIRNNIDISCRKASSSGHRQGMSALCNLS